MKIELQEPYASKWKNGYIVTNPENRKTVILYNSHEDRSSVSLARYMMSCKMGRLLCPEEEQVDHVNEDKTDDRLDNFQLLTKLENHHKTHKTGQTMIDFSCPVCGIDFQLTSRQSHKKNPTCSRRCGGIKSHWKH